MKNAFRTLSFRSEPTIGEECLRRSAKCTAEAPSARGDKVKKSRGFKVIYLSDSERTASSENELRKVYKQYVKSVSPNSSFKGHLQRVRGNTMQPER